MVKTAFLFPGQGAQTVGMAVELCRSTPAAQTLFDRASSILGYDLLAVCAEGPKERLDSTIISQPAIFVASLAALEQLQQTQPATIEECTACAGLSLGEYTALTFAGALAFEDGLRLVKKRGEAMQAAADATPSGMVSVLLLEQPQLEQLIEQASAKGTLRIANFLCPGNLVVSGAKAACEELIQLATAANARVVPLAVAGAFHTPIMQPAVEELSKALESVSLSPPRVPVWANVTAQPYESLEQIKPTLARQVVEPVLWEKTMRGMLDAGIERFVEIGPGRVLAGLLKRINRKAECHNVQCG